MAAAKQEVVQVRRDDLVQLQQRLDEAEELLNAIRTGSVDTLVVGLPGEEHIYTLDGAEHPYRVLVEAMQEGAATLLPDGTLLYCNRSLADMLGFQIDDLIGKALKPHVVHADLELFDRFIQEALSGRSSADVHLTTRQGAPIPVHLSGTHIELESTEAIGIVISDLSLQKRNELLEAQVEERTRDLSERNRELQNFAYVASHDLQEPLRKIRTFAGMLASESSGSLDERSTFYLGRVVNAAERMSGLLNDLLAYSRVGTQTLPFEHIDLTSVAQDAAADFDLALKETNGTIEVGQLPPVFGDPVQIRQLITNLISNAVKFQNTEESPRIEVRGTARDGHCVLEVIDNGIGFEERYADRIFEPFQRLHGRGTHPGTGMGLAICKRIVDRHAGTIAAYSEPGKGSRFVVELPLGDDAMFAEQAAVAENN